MGVADPGDKARGDWVGMSGDEESLAVRIRDRDVRIDVVQDVLVKDDSERRENAVETRRRKACIGARLHRTDSGEQTPPLQQPCPNAIRLIARKRYAGTRDDDDGASIE